MIFKIIYNGVLFLFPITVRNLGICVSCFWAFRLKTTGMHVSILGAGVTAHARHRTNAIKRIEFLVRSEVQ
jgi:ABC-type Fe3+ transport system substrate-binding protein